MNKEKLFVTSCLSIATAAMVFAIRGDVAGPMSAASAKTAPLSAARSPFWLACICVISLMETTLRGAT